ncbi:MAG: Dolichyl-phosphate-mannose-protein mannosyltransferase [Pseudomonadota bacterium]
MDTPGPLLSRSPFGAGPPSLERGLFVWGLVAAAAWRLRLSGRFAGWEESDYGNLAMIQGVLDGGFLHYDMNHMPGYYAMGAALHAVLDDALWAGRSLDLIGGLVAWALAVQLARRLFGLPVAVISGLLLIVQPEFALYTGSQLREPVYTGALMGCLSALIHGRLLLAGLLAALTFSVRFDAMFILPPLVLGALLGARPRPSPRALLGALLPLPLAIGAWSAYCSVEHGTWAFWSHSVEVNVETGLGAEHEDRGAWLRNGARVAWGMAGHLLPWRIGWGVWIGLLVGLVRAPWRESGGVRTLHLAGLLLLGFWLSVGFVGQHEPDHNLYWKWMYPLVPVLVPIGVAGLLGLLQALPARLGAAPRVAVVALALLQALASAHRETERQVLRSVAWYQPQVDLAAWIEAQVPEQDAVWVDNIPACWLRRRPQERRMTSWYDIETQPEGDPVDLARQLRAGEVRWVLWFAEGWTQAPRVAPALAAGGIIELDGVQLIERAREDGYGWIFYQVAPPGPPPPLPAPLPALPPEVAAYAASQAR